MKYITQQNIGKYNDLFLDVEGLELPHMDNVKDLLQFPINTYRKLSPINSQHGACDSSLGIINKFFTTLTDADCKQIAMSLLLMHHTIHTYRVNDTIHSIFELTETLSEILSDLDKSVDLYPKLYQFNLDYIPRADNSAAGTNPEDTPIITWTDDHVCRLLPLIVLCKLCTPIFGAFMTYLRDENVESMTKEVHTARILNGVIRNRIPDLYEKLEQYIKIHSRSFKESTTTIHYGVTTASNNNRLMAHLMVRNFINMDLMKPDSKVMTYVASTVRLNSTNALSAKASVGVRRDMSSVPDEQKRSQMEVDSVTTSGCALVIPLVRFKLQHLIETWIHDYAIGINEYNSCRKHFNSNPIAIHGLNTFILHEAIGPKLGGAQSISYMSVSEVVDIVALLQMIAIQRGYRQLAHGIAAVVSVTGKHTSTEDVVLRMTHKSSAAYRNMRSRMEQSPTNPKELVTLLDRHIDDIVNMSTSTNMLYNTPPFLWNVIGEQDINNTPIQFGPDLVKSILEFVHELASGEIVEQ